jgi:hypothetical protein
MYSGAYGTRSSQLIILIDALLDLLYVPDLHAEERLLHSVVDERVREQVDATLSAAYPSALINWGEPV